VIGQEPTLRLFYVEKQRHTNFNLLFQNRPLFLSCFSSKNEPYLHRSLSLPGLLPPSLPCLPPPFSLASPPVRLPSVRPSFRPSARLSVRRSVLPPFVRPSPVLLHPSFFTRPPSPVFLPHHCLPPPPPPTTTTVTTLALPPSAPSAAPPELPAPPSLPPFPPLPPSSPSPHPPPPPAPRPSFISLLVSP
jgi:hypothetical protein